MVKGLRALERKLNVSIPRAVERHLKQAMERFADRVVASAEAFVPEAAGALKNSIGWVWGTDIPKGAMSLGTVAGAAGDDMVITIFAGDDEAYYARWIEFGTQAHSTTKNASVKRGKRQTGTIHKGTNAQPFFYPAYRLNKRAGKSGLTRAIKKGLKEGSR